MEETDHLCANTGELIRSIMPYFPKTVIPNAAAGT
jgi:hypothetical protein